MNRSDKIPCNKYWMANLFEYFYLIHLLIKDYRVIQINKQVWLYDQTRLKVWKGLIRADIDQLWWIRYYKHCKKKESDYTTSGSTC